MSHVLQHAFIANSPRISTATSSGSSTWAPMAHSTADTGLSGSIDGLENSENMRFSYSQTISPPDVADNPKRRALPSDTTCQMIRRYQTSRVQPFKASPGHWWCPYCLETAGRFTKASDMWKHVDHFHEKGSSWKCRHTACKLHFCHQEDYATHHKKQHSLCASKCWSIRAVDVVAAVCGMEGCEAIFCGTAVEKGKGNAIYDARQHIAKHMKEGRGPASWDYSTIIRNLLRQPGILELWKALVRSEGFNDPSWPELTWAQCNPDLIKFQLETGSFDDMKKFLTKVYENAKLTLRFPPPRIWTLDPTYEEPEGTGPLQKLTSINAHSADTQAHRDASAEPAIQCMSSHSSENIASRSGHEEPSKASPRQVSAAARLHVHRQSPYKLSRANRAVPWSPMSKFRIAGGTNCRKGYQRTTLANDATFCFSDQQPTAASSTLNSPLVQSIDTPDVSNGPTVSPHDEAQGFGPETLTIHQDSAMGFDNHDLPEADHWPVGSLDCDPFDAWQLR